MHIADRHWLKLCHPVFYLWSVFASHTHDTCQGYFQDSKTRNLYEATGKMLTLYSRLWPLPPPFALKFCQRVRPPPGWLVVTRPAAGHPSSVLSRAFYQSNFAILVICPHTLASCVLWSGPENQLCFRVHHHLLRAHRPRVFFTDSTKRSPMLCVFTAKRMPSGIRLDATWRSLLMILLTSAFWLRCMLANRFANNACACVRNVVWFKAASIGCIIVSLSVGQPPPWPVAWLCWPSNTVPSFDAFAFLHCLSPSLDCFCQNFPKVSVDMTATPTCCLLLVLFVRTPLCLRLSLLDPVSIFCAWPVTILLNVALHQVSRVLS